MKHVCQLGKRVLVTQRQGGAGNELPWEEKKKKEVENNVSILLVAYWFLLLAKAPADSRNQQQSRQALRWNMKSVSAANVCVVLQMLMLKALSF